MKPCLGLSVARQTLYRTVPLPLSTATAHSSIAGACRIKAPWQSRQRKATDDKSRLDAWVRASTTVCAAATVKLTARNRQLQTFTGRTPFCKAKLHDRFCCTRSLLQKEVWAQES